jgi:class 3 adenylate cyclase
MVGSSIAAFTLTLASFTCGFSSDKVATDSIGTKHSTPMNETRPSRRLAAILAADVAGYSRMMGADETGTLGALKSCMTDTVVPHFQDHR